MRKTSGNPFFAIQFLSALAEEGLLTFDHDACAMVMGSRSHPRQGLHRQRRGSHGREVEPPAGRNPAGIAAAGLSGQQRRDRDAWRWFAGLGARKSTSDLWEAVRQELIVRSEAPTRFLHDRVQEAAYSLIPKELRAAAHLRIGRLLAAHTPAEKREEAIFEIVNQLNRGAMLMTSRTREDPTCRTELDCRPESKNSAAYRSALNYFSPG